ncbi:MAG: hypothetical protein ACEQSK_03460 [Sphingomonadaceae bacterium]
MKKVLLILLMLAIPWQAIAAAERNLTHVLGSANAIGMDFVIKHIAEHADHVLHHHDDDDDDDDDSDDGGTHLDNSQKSLQHLADFEHGSHLNIALPAINMPGLPLVVRVAPSLRHDVFSDRTILPLLRPPRSLI